MSTSETGGQIVRFNGFEFEPSSGDLRPNGGSHRVRLEPQPAKVLSCLIEKAGQVVTRDELRQRVWPADTFVDFEHGLNYCIAQIRNALGDSATAPQFVETLPRRGYRFVAQVDPPAIVRDPAAAPALDPIGKTRPWTRLAALLATLVVIAAVAVWAALTLAGTTGRDVPKLAVVPFDNETAWPEGDGVAGRLTDAVVARLAADPDRLGVIGNAAILRQPRATRDLKLIARTLDVQYAVLGQVQQNGNGLRVITHLIRTSDQTHLWAWRFESGREDVSELETRLVETVASAVFDRLGVK